MDLLYSSGSAVDVPLASSNGNIIMKVLTSTGSSILFEKSVLSPYVQQEYLMPRLACIPLVIMLSIIENLRWCMIDANLQERL